MKQILITIAAVVLVGCTKRDIELVGGKAIYAIIVRLKCVARKSLNC